MIKAITSYFFSNPQYSLTNKFETLLAARDQDKISTFIHEHPTLVNEKLSNGLSPIAFAISQKNTSAISTLLANNAQINQVNSYNITPLDYMINMSDGHLIRGVFGKFFSEIISHTSQSLHKDFLPHQRDEIKKNFLRHLDALKNEVIHYRSDSNPIYEGNPFIKLIIDSELKYLREILTDSESSINHHQIFCALIYAAINHKNEAIELFHEVLGDEIIKLRTVDFKDLYHIAAISDNTKLVYKLNEWGLIPSNPADLPGESYSPYFYALAHPTLNTFFALLKSKAPISLSIDLKNVNDKITPCSKLNPFQFLALRAYFNGVPLHTTLDNLHITYFSLDVLLSVLALVDFEQESIGDSFKSYLSEAKNLVFALNTFNLSLSLINEASSSRFKTFLKLTSFIACLGITNYIYDSSILTHHQWVPLTYCTISSILLIKKIWNDLNKYKVNYQMQPWQTLKVAMQDMLLNAFHIKNIAFDWSALLNANSAVPAPTSPKLSASVPLNNNHTHNTKEVLLTLDGEKIVKPSLEKINQCLVRYKISGSDQFYNYRIKNDFNQLFKCLFPDYSKNLAYSSNDFDQNKRIFKQLSKITHTDKCIKAQVPIEVIKSAKSKTINEFCQKLWLKYFNWYVELAKP